MALHIFLLFAVIIFNQLPSHCSRSAIIHTWLLAITHCFSYLQYVLWALNSLGSLSSIYAPEISAPSFCICFLVVLIFLKTSLLFIFSIHVILNISQQNHICHLVSSWFMRKLSRIHLRLDITYQLSNFFSFLTIFSYVFLVFCLLCQTSFIIPMCLWISVPHFLSSIATLPR